MSHQIKLAAIQMNAQPAALEDRLHRAEGLIARAAEDGAQLAVLPEVFNTGYVYSDNNYQLAETFDGPTLGWMKSMARKYNIYLVGSLLLREADDIYNTQILISPLGKHWRYDKSFPWAWERAYFRGGSGPQVAETPLGTFGMLICWDVAHPQLWASYAGKVDAMLVSSCPPMVGKASFTLPDGSQVAAAELGAAMQQIYRGAEHTFGALLRQQATWLGVPVAASAVSGTFLSTLPRAKASMSVFFAMRPDLWKHLADAEKILLESCYYNETYIAAANGQVLAQVQGDRDGFASSLVSIADAMPKAEGRQPAFGLHPLTYSLDAVAEPFLGNYYRIRAKGG